MPLGTEYAHGAGSIRAAAALADYLELPDDEGMRFEWISIGDVDDGDSESLGGAYLFHHPYEPGADYYIVEDYWLGIHPAVLEPVEEAGGWSIFDEQPWGT